MSASVGVFHFRSGHFAILRRIDLKRLCVSKMLEYLSVFISYRDFHMTISFQMTLTKLDAVTAAYLEMAAFNAQPSALHDKTGQLASGRCVQGLDRGPRRVHLTGAGFLCHARVIDQTECLILFHGKHQAIFRIARSAKAYKLPAPGHPADPPAFARTRHEITPFPLIIGLLLSYVNNSIPIFLSCSYPSAV